jgi:hypothetical protein
MNEEILEDTDDSVYEPQDELEDSDGQVEYTDEEASEAELDEYDFLSLDENADRYVTVKVDGEEVVVPLSEALAGYQRQADYTRKTQEISEQKKSIQTAAALQEALANNPMETLQLLQEHYGITQSVQSDEEDIWQDPLVKELNEIKAWKRDLEYKQTLSEVEKEIQSLEGKYGEDFNREEVIAKALATGSTDLEATFKMIHFDRIFQEKKKATQQVAATKQRTNEKRKAQVVSGSSSSSGTTTAPTSSPKSVIEAFRDAQKTLGY